MDELTGRIIGGRYRVESFEGRGGMANVYKVWDLQRAVYLAMKVLHSDLAEDRVFLRRFKREAQMLERLQHPNIVRFYGLEESEGLAYILMDYIEGLTLRREIYMNNNGMRPSRILQIMQPVCAALHYAHLMGMVHCDIKPVNIIIHRNGTVFLADFGIARVTGARTQTALVSGTPAYMAPEQSLGEDPSPSSDIYALGVVLFEMLTGGERPFTGDSVVSAGKATQRIIWEKSNLDPPPPSRFNPHVTPELEAVTLRCLERDPSLRFVSTLELSGALAEAVHGDGGNYDIQTLTNIDLSPQEGIHPPFWMDEEFLEPAADNQPAAGNLPAGELPELPGRPGKVEPEAAASVEGVWQVRDDTPAHVRTPLLDNEWQDDAGSQVVEPPAGVPPAGPAEQALVLALPAALVRKTDGDQARRRLNRWWLLAGIVLAVLLGIGLALTREPPPVVSPSVAAASPPAASAAVTGPPASTGTPARPAPTATRVTSTPQATATPQPLPTLLGGGSGKIAFASDRSGSVQIWVMDADDPDRREQVTRLPGGACQPAWSPDGKRLALITPCNGPRLTYPGARIMILELESGELVDLKLVGSAFDPAWSPDGKTIAYTTFLEGRTVIFAVDLAEMKPYPLVTSGQKNEDPDWSPDGKTIAYISDNEGIDEIWVIHKDGSSKEMVTEAGLLKYFSSPKWAPDGRWMTAMMKQLNMAAPVPVMVLLDRFDGRSGGTPLLEETTRMEDGNFSADGQWLVYWTVLDGSNMEILRANRAGVVERLTDHTARDFHPDWGWH